VKLYNIIDARSIKTKRKGFVMLDVSKPHPDVAGIRQSNIIDDLMPAYHDIPAEFKSINNEWSKWQSMWFFEGLEATPVPKEGIDAHKAMLHLAAIQRSFIPRHKHKAAAVAYLASLWFLSKKEAGI
jgi:hypothetical protein